MAFQGFPTTITLLLEHDYEYFIPLNYIMNSSCHN